MLLSCFTRSNAEHYNPHHRSRSLQGNLQTCDNCWQQLNSEAHYRRAILPTEDCDETCDSKSC